MDKKQARVEARGILAREVDIVSIADAFKRLWLAGERRTQNLVKREQRELITHQGIAVDLLQALGDEAGSAGPIDTSARFALAEFLWNDYGREGRIVAAHLLGKLNPIDAKTTLSLSRRLVTTCVSWEECDTMTYAVEPVIRQKPKEYLAELEPWLADANKWVKRVALNVLARLPMKQPTYTKAALSMLVPCLSFDDHDVRRTCSFAVRLAARGDRAEVIQFMKRHIGGDDATTIWILSDVIRSMTKSFLPDFTCLLPAFRTWRAAVSAAASCDAHACKSLDAAIRVLEGA